MMARAPRYCAVWRLRYVRRMATGRGVAIRSAAPFREGGATWGARFIPSRQNGCVG